MEKYTFKNALIRRRNERYIITKLSDFETYYNHVRDDTKQFISNLDIKILPNGHLKLLGKKHKTLDVHDYVKHNSINNVEWHYMSFSTYYNKEQFDAVLKRDDNVLNKAGILKKMSTVVTRKKYRFPFTIEKIEFRRNEFRGTFVIKKDTESFHKIITQPFEIIL